MTDSKTATERICEQLEVAGLSFVRSEQIIEGTYWGVTWSVGETKFEFRENDERTDLIAFNATPEQAIAATLGSGTLTAEQVMAIAGKHQPDYCSDTHVCFDWQAITDELNATLGSDAKPCYATDLTHDSCKYSVNRGWIENATLGSGECEFVIEDNMNETEGMGDVWFRCTSCNTCFDYYADDWLMKQNYCPHCGKAVKR